MKLSEEEKASHREAFKKMDLKDKMIYIFSYYKAFIIIPLLILIVAISFISDRLSRKEDILYLGLVNVAAGEELLTSLDEGFVLSLEEEPKKKEVFIYNDLYLSEHATGENERYAYASRIKIIASIETQKFDLVITNKEGYDILSNNGYLLDLNDPSATNLKAAAKDHITQNIVPDISQSVSNGILLKDSPLIKKAGFGEDLYLCIIANTPRPDILSQYLSYLMN